MNTFLVMVSLLAIWPFGSGKEYRMTAGPGVPAATGVVKAEKDKDNGNTKLNIRVEHLANPSSLTPPASAYIVWVRPTSGDAVKQGAIRVDKNLKGELNVVTLAKDFDVLITAEQNEGVTSPSQAEVLRTHVNPL